MATESLVLPSPCGGAPIHAPSGMVLQCGISALVEATLFAERFARLSAQGVQPVQRRAPRHGSQLCAGPDGSRHRFSRPSLQIRLDRASATFRSAWPRATFRASPAPGRGPLGAESQPAGRGVSAWRRCAPPTGLIVPAGDPLLGLALRCCLVTIARTRVRVITARPARSQPAGARGLSSGMPRATGACADP